MIDGLTYTRDYLTKPQEESLISFLDDESWDRASGRRHLNFGFVFSRKDVYIEDDYHLPLPAGFILNGAQALVRDGKVKVEPNQCTADEFMPAQSMMPLVDAPSCYGDTIAILTLGSGICMNFINEYDPSVETNKTIKTRLEPCSLLVLSGKARHWWRRLILPLQEDIWKGENIKRGRTILLTYRFIMDKFDQIDDQTIFDFRALGGTLGGKLRTEHDDIPF